MTHPFEAAGLGTAPFQFLFCERVVADNCQFCGTKIRYRFFCKGADGHRFFVGSDCVKKTSADTRFGYDVESADRLIRKDAADEALRCRVEFAHAALDADLALLTDMPHSLGWRGKSARNEVVWLLNAGKTNTTKAVRMIENALKVTESA